MNILKRDSILQSVVVASPCSVSWNEMTGTDIKRFCSSCNLNVHNLTGMSTRDAELLLKSDPSKRPCVYFYRNSEGLIVSDNCPNALKPLRNDLGQYASAVIIALTACLALNVSANVLPEVAYALLGQTDIETARDIADLVTAISFVITLFYPLNEKEKDRVKLLVTRMIALAVIPLLVHFAGTFIVNNYMPMTGGL